MKEKLSNSVISEEFALMRKKDFESEKGAYFIQGEIKATILYAKEIIDQRYPHLNQTDRIYASKDIAASGAVGLNKEGVPYRDGITVEEHVNLTLQQLRASTDLSKVDHRFKNQ